MPCAAEWVGLQIFWDTHSCYNVGPPEAVLDSISTQLLPSVDSSFSTEKDMVETCLDLASEHGGSHGQQTFFSMFPPRGQGTSYQHFLQEHPAAAGCGMRRAAEI